MSYYCTIAVGGVEGPAAYAIDRHTADLTRSYTDTENPRILHIAAASEDDPDVIERHDAIFTDLGCSVGHLALTGEVSVAQVEDALANANGVHLTGGDPHALMRAMRQNIGNETSFAYEFLQLLGTRPLVNYGNSAGTLALAKHGLTIANPQTGEENPNTIFDFDGLATFGESMVIAPHSTDRTSPRVQELLRRIALQPELRSAIAIDDLAAYVTSSNPQESDYAIAAEPGAGLSVYTMYTDKRYIETPIRQL